MRHSLGLRSAVLGLSCALVGLLSGCATLAGKPVSGGAAGGTVSASGTGANAASGSGAVPTCPESIAAEPQLELGYRDAMAARRWLPALTLEQLGFDAKDAVAPGFQKELALTSGPLQVFGLMEQSKQGQEAGGSVVVARPHEKGFCVVNSWSTWQPSRVDLSLAGTWTSVDGRLAIFLLKLGMPQAPEGARTRWVVLGTDGRRVWTALGTPPEHQLIVPSAVLFPNGKDLYLDIKQRYTTRLRLGQDGRFIMPAPAK